MYHKVKEQEWRIMQYEITIKVVFLSLRFNVKVSSQCDELSVNTI